MTAAVMRAMWLSLLQDRGLLAMTFLTPVVFFVIFAEVFATATGGEFLLNIAVADEVRSADSQRLLAQLARSPMVRRFVAATDRDDVRRQVRSGDADAGIVVRGDAAPLGSAEGPAPLLLVIEPSRAVAATVIAGQLQQAYFRGTPDLALRSAIGLIESEFTSLDPSQRQEIEAGLAEVRLSAGAADTGGGGGLGLASLYQEEPVAGQPAALNHIAYYAGALAFLFVLLSASHGALTLLEERDNGILDRVAAGPGGLAVVINGKFLFLMTQGIAQTVLIFLTARLGYGVNVTAIWPAWLAIVVISSAAAAAIGLALVSACRSRAQAQTFSTIAVLLMSAIGGSMVPRFFMPELLRDIGWLTPNAWALEAYTGLLWRGEPLGSLLLPLGLLVGALALGLPLSHRLARELIRV
jgi:ABC-2 type transport system permease protein